MEQNVQRKKIFRSDWLLFILVVFFLFLCTIALNYFSALLQRRLVLLQFVIYFLIFGACYFVLYRQLSAYRYVLRDAEFFVYHSTGKKQRMVEQIPLKSIRFIVPYDCNMEEKGREHDCSISKKTSRILAHTQNGKLQYLLFSPDEALLEMLQQAIPK